MIFDTLHEGLLQDKLPNDQRVDEQRLDRCPDNTTNT